MTTQQALDLAISHHQSGRFGDAEAIYRKILAVQPDNANALHLLGMLIAQTGEPLEGIKLIQQSVDAHPNVALFHLNLGETYRRMGKLDPARESFQRAIQLDSSLCEAHNNLSGVLADTGDLDGAIAAAKAALALQPEFAEAHFNLGNALKKKGEKESAVAAFRRAIELQSDYADAYTNMSTVLYQLEQFNEAIEACNTAIRLKPDSPQAYNNLGASLDARNRPEEALAAYGIAVRLDPNDAVAHANLGFALARKGDLDQALASCATAIRLKANYADAYCYQAFVLNEKGLLEEALESASRAVEIDPSLAIAHNTMGNVLKDMGRIPEALAAYRRAIESSPKDSGFHSNLAYTLYFDPDCTPAQLLSEHLAWSHQHADPLKSKILPHENNRDPNRRLRIGYVSPDFRAHPVGRFLLPLLANHDHSDFEIFCYASVVRPDVFTPRIQSHVDIWRDIRTLPNDEVAALIRQDQIDILVDLTMHMGANRLLLFAQKPAPIQVTYLAYAGTTGLDTIDYRLTDPYLDPPDMPQKYYTEKSIHLAHSYWCYQPTIDDLKLTPLPAASAGFITFGCLNNFCKLTSATLQTWIKLLIAVSDSRLILHAGAGGHRDGISKKFSDSGIESHRITFVEKLSLPKYMDQYSQIDIALDPFPYVGGTTTCDALWMGVPVITLAGQTAISRGGVSILSNIGHPEMIAQTLEQYIKIAVDLAGDRDRLINLRSTLRHQMSISPLMDGKLFASDMEAAYRQMWAQFIRP